MACKNLQNDMLSFSTAEIEAGLIEKQQTNYVFTSF